MCRDCGTFHKRNKIGKDGDQGDKRAKRLFRLTREPAKFLATIQVAITLSGFLGSAFAADNFSDPLVDWVINLGITVPRATLDTIAVVLITLILSYFTLVFGELVPKRVAMKKAEALGLGISGLISGISIVFKPIVWFLSASTDAVLRLLGIDPNEADEQVSEEEIRMMVDAGSEKGAIDEQEKEFIQHKGNLPPSVNHGCIAIFVGISFLQFVYSILLHFGTDSLSCIVQVDGIKVCHLFL